MMQGTRILVIGDLMLDSYIQGSVDRISPEAPVPVLKMSNRFSIPGGAGNVVRNLSGLGENVTLVSGIGDDEAGSRLMESFSEDGVVFLPAAWKKPTTRKTRITSAKHQMLRIDEEDAAPSQPDDERKIQRIIENLNWDDHKTIIISDYAKGLCTPAICRHAIESAITRNLPVLVDPKGIDWEKYRALLCLPRT